MSQLHKRVENLEKSAKVEEDRFSWTFNVKAQLAAITNPVFGKLSGIKSAEEGKNASQWTKKEQSHWAKFWQKQIIQRSHFSITYLAKENAFFNRSIDGTSGFVFNDGSERDIYSETIIEKNEKPENMFRLDIESLTIHARDRYIKLDNKTGLRVLTIYFLEKEGGKENYKILCDFPFTNPRLADENKQLGFEVQHSDGDVYEDKNKPFGPIPGYSKGPDITYWRKNGVEISFVKFSG